MRYYSHSTSDMYKFLFIFILNTPRASLQSLASPHPEMLGMAADGGGSVSGFNNQAQSSVEDCQNLNSAMPFRRRRMSSPSSESKYIPVSSHQAAELRHGPSRSSSYMDLGFTRLRLSGIARPMLTLGGLAQHGGAEGSKGLICLKHGARRGREDRFS